MDSVEGNRVSIVAVSVGCGVEVGEGSKVKVAVGCNVAVCEGVRLGGMT